MVEDRFYIAKINKILKEYETPYSIDERKNGVYLVEYDKRGNKKYEELLPTDNKRHSINDAAIATIAKIMFQNKSKIGRSDIDWTKPENIAFDLTAQPQYNPLERAVTTTIVVSSLLIITLSSLTITGNAIANSPEFAKSATFALFVVLVLSFIIFLKTRKRRNKCNHQKVTKSKGF